LPRPFDFRQDIADEICQELIGGKSMRTITKPETMPSQWRVYQWLAQNEDFRKQYADARAKQADAIFDECLDIADECSNDFAVDSEGNVKIDHDAINRAKLRIDTRKWMAGKLRPKVYGDKIEVDNRSSDGSMTPKATIDVSKLTDDELAALTSAAARLTQGS